MKLAFASRSSVCPRRHPRQRGYIMLALIVIVTLMLFYVAACSRTIYQLQRELTALERAQVKRLAHSPPASAAASDLPPSGVARNDTSATSAP